MNQDNQNKQLNLANDGYPIPPESLRWRVVGNKDVEAYLQSGRRVAKHFSEIISSSGEDLARFESILVF